MIKYLESQVSMSSSVQVKRHGAVEVIIATVCDGDGRHACQLLTN
jgi:hypothetical protein